MYFKDGCILRDQNDDFDGARGDSCFDTNSFGLSHLHVNSEYHSEINVNRFFDENNQTVRHPEVKWRHDDMTEDNEKPLFMLCRALTAHRLTNLIKDNIVNNGYKTGNGKVVTLGYLAELTNWQSVRCFTQTAQVLFFWFFWYWDDGRFKNWWINMKLNFSLLTWRYFYEPIWQMIKLTWKYWPIGNNWKKSDGYLQWALTAQLTPWIFRKLVRKKTLKYKIGKYYEPEFKATHATVALWPNHDTTHLIVGIHMKMVDLL